MKNHGKMKTGHRGWGVWLLLWLASCFFPWTVDAGDWSSLRQRLQDDGFDRTKMEELYRRPELRFDPEPMAVKITTLMQRHARQGPAGEAMNTRAVYRRYLRPAALRSARNYLQENRRWLKRINREYCVPEEVVVSIMLIETDLGNNTGKRMAFGVLSSMALAADLERVRSFLPAGTVHGGNEELARRFCKERSDWAYEELKHLLRYSQANGIDPLSIPGSMYGAIGLCQFMPSNVSRYGIDGDGSGGIDLFSTPDALYSIGNYLRQHGWRCLDSRQERRRVVMTYNHSQRYANTVLAVADRLRAMNRKGNDRLGKERGPEKASPVMSSRLRNG